METHRKDELFVNVEKEQERLLSEIEVTPVTESEEGENNVSMQESIPRSACTVEDSSAVMEDLEVDATGTSESSRIVKQSEQLAEREPPHCVDGISCSVISDYDSDNENQNNTVNESTSKVAEDLRDQIQVKENDENLCTQNRHDDDMECQDLKEMVSSQGDNRTTETPIDYHQYDKDGACVAFEASILLPPVSDKIEESKMVDSMHSNTLGITDEGCSAGMSSSKNLNTFGQDIDCSQYKIKKDGPQKEQTIDDALKMLNKSEEVKGEIEASDDIFEDVETGDTEIESNDKKYNQEGSESPDKDSKSGENIHVLATDETFERGSVSETNQVFAEDDVIFHHDATSNLTNANMSEESKIPSKTSTAEKRSKASYKGFSLGNIVSRLKIQVESKQEEVDISETKKDAGDAIPEKTQSKRSEQKQQGKQMRAAAHAAMMMCKDSDYDEQETRKEDATQQTEGQSKDITTYASNTMDELLGLYGYDQLEKDECDGLQCSSSLSKSKIPITGSVTSLKQSQKLGQTQKASQEDTGLVISNVTSMAPAQDTAEDPLKVVSKKKINYCAECSHAVDDTALLVASDHSFCSQACLDNYQGRQTLVCDYCCGMITQAATQKFVRETQEGQKKFCSQPCSEEFSKRVRNCSTCGKEISKASEGILAPVGSGGKFVDFCQQECVDNYGKKPSVTQQDCGKQDGGQPRYWAQDTYFVCAVCKNYAKAKHVISLQGKLNGLCSTDCFTQFKEKNQLAFSLCSQCSALCSNQKMMRSIEIEGKVHRFCSMRCFKMKLKRSMSTIACAACKKPNWAQSMIEEWNGTELVRFFCSTACLGKRETIPFTSTQNVTVPTNKTSIPPLGKSQPSSLKQQKPQQSQQTSQGSGARLTSAGGNKCDHCSKQQRPQYHLTMSDNSIRNFCSYGCVIAFQAQFNVPPVTLPQETLQLTCSQCHQGFSNKPLPLEFKGAVNVFCAQNCMDEFKRVNSVVVECDYCHLEKILHERIYFSGEAHSFCSEGCKLLFKQQFAQRLGLRCTVCDYCAQTCRSRVERMYGNHKKKFCSMACKSQYDKWLSKGAKCDGCKCTGRKLEESFIWRGEMKRVCNQHCLLLFYAQQNIPNMNTQTQSTIPAIQLSQVAPKTTTPVITNVVSLAPGQQQTSGSPNNIQYQPKCATQNIVAKKCHKQTQITTAAPKAHRPPPPPVPVPPAPTMVKNKVTLVKPFTQTKSVSCRPLTSSKATMTDDQQPLIIPVPVPIFVPVPMRLYTTPVPHPVSLPVPIPVPMFIPVAYNNADRLLASIQEISERIPSDPLEAEMLMLADAIAGDEGSKGSQDSKVDGQLEMNNLQTLAEGDDFGGLGLENAEDTEPSHFLADSILKMAADIAEVLEDDGSTELQDDLNSLQPVEEPRIDVSVRTTRSKSSKTSGRRGRSRGNKRACVEGSLNQDPEEPPPQVRRSKDESRNTIGVNAYRYFVFKKKQNVTGKDLKSFTWNPNLLEVSTEELGYILCLMCKEGTQPNGNKYSADVLHLIFLSIQQHLSDNGRPENVFTDQFYRRFTDLLHDEIKEWMIDRDPITDFILNTCINEETLWSAKQLGAHSPYILLSTMIYFNTKHFQLKTLATHKALAFCRIQKHVRKVGTTRSLFLRYYPADRKKVIELAGKRKRDRDSEMEPSRLEQSENTENPLRCPVRLYEFYLSKCPDSVKSHSELFYLVPERSCVPDSPVWYSSAPLADHDMSKILTRMLMVMDIYESWAEINKDEDY
ncbi:zinc finger MYM-type protein 3-like isoform X2 [Acanthaster planci]|uniref:Zinc finger MYM-type protein 3-like isoform X2 n=1 Tax=Acanthaster planci TaxID=133434 RepID=A0A8B7XQU3_ACAPL|nr:zinc finger MYM-type protein 3-like isoform X2 [Acanthaster planci]